MLFIIGNYKYCSNWLLFYFKCEKYIIKIFTIFIKSSNTDRNIHSITAMLDQCKTLSFIQPSHFKMQKLIIHERHKLFSPRPMRWKQEIWFRHQCFTVVSHTDNGHGSPVVYQVHGSVHSLRSARFCLQINKNLR